MAWELAEYAARGSRADHPTLSSMLDAVNRSYGLKALVFFLWLCLGAAIVRRGGRASAARARERGAVSSPLSYAVWAVLGLAPSASGSAPTPADPRWPAPACVLERLATGPFLRVALVLAWIWMGWHLFAR